MQLLALASPPRHHCLHRQQHGQRQLHWQQHGRLRSWQQLSLCHGLRRWTRQGRASNRAPEEAAVAAEPISHKAAQKQMAALGRSLARGAGLALLEGVRKAGRPTSLPVDELVAGLQAAGEPPPAAAADEIQRFAVGEVT
eukprot:SM000696S20526  [mRNA]  locus=s696:66:809:+ [translate_table: standard]